MNPTKAFLLNEMANAQSLEEFFLAHRAIVRLNQLAAERGLGMMQPQPPRQAQNEPYPVQRDPRWDVTSNIPNSGPRSFRDSDVAPDFDSMGGGAGMPFDL